MRIKIDDISILESMKYPTQKRDRVSLCNKCTCVHKPLIMSEPDFCQVMFNQYHSKAPSHYKTNGENNDFISELNYGPEHSKMNNLI